MINVRIPSRRNATLRMMYVVLPTISCSLMCSSLDVSLTFCIAHVVSGDTSIHTYTCDTYIDIFLLCLIGDVMSEMLRAE